MSAELKAEQTLTVSEARAAGFFVAEFVYGDAVMRAYGRTADHAWGRILVELSACTTILKPLLAGLCPCGKPLAHLQAEPDSADWSCRVPVATS